jgi:ADP-heptose:LPS heptosyltransferase
LRAHFKEAHIGLLVISRSAELIKDCPYIDDLFILDIKYTRLRDLFRGKALIRVYRTIKKLHQQKFDMLINLQRTSSWGGSFKMAILFWLIGGKYKVGRDTDGRGFFFNFKIKESSQEHKHEVEANLNVARALGANIDEVKLELPIFDEDRIFISNFLTRHDISDKDLLIGLNPGAFHPSRRWLEKRWAQLANRLIGKYSCKIIIISHKTEKKIVDGIANLIEKKPIIVAKNLSLKQLAALIEKLDLFITNDTGPMHIAVATQTPLIALFGPGDIHSFSPYCSSNKSVIIRKEVNCRRPCRKFKCRSRKCMELITVEDVMKAVEGILV